MGLAAATLPRATTYRHSPWDGLTLKMTRSEARVYLGAAPTGVQIGTPFPLLVCERISETP